MPLACVQLLSYEPSCCIKCQTRSSHGNIILQLHDRPWIENCSLLNGQETGCTEIQVFICEKHLPARGICLSSCPWCWVTYLLNNSVQSILTTTILGALRTSFSCSEPLLRFCRTSELPRFLKPDSHRYAKHN